MSNVDKVDYFFNDAVLRDICTKYGINCDKVSYTSLATELVQSVNIVHTTIIVNQKLTPQDNITFV